jgi:hypothetical protein
MHRDCALAYAAEVRSVEMQGVVHLLDWTEIAAAEERAE